MKKGFTLIELLVVIAIIGLLAAIVTASLTIARHKATNAAIRDILSNSRAEAELYFDSNGTYDGVCEITGMHIVGNMVRAALTAAGDNSNIDTKCLGTGQGWVAFSPLKISEGANTHFCVDSAGRSMNIQSSTPGHQYLLDGLDANEEHCPTS